MSKIGLMAFATAFLLTGGAYATDKIALTCSGTEYAEGLGHEQTKDIPNETYVIDLDQKTVTTDHDFSNITTLTDVIVDFESVGHRSDGRMNRVAGSLEIRSFGSDDILHDEPYSKKYLTCKPAKPLF
jgi:hypothetical protein